MRTKLLFFGIFGFLGAVGRMLIFEWIHSSLGTHLAILGINIMGTFWLGFGLEHATTSKNQFWNENHREILSGFLGSFTTFATFEADFYQLSTILDFWPVFVWILIEILVSVLFFKLGIIGAQIHDARKSHFGRQQNAPVSIA